MRLNFKWQYNNNYNQTTTKIEWESNENTEITFTKCEQMTLKSSIYKCNIAGVIKGKKNIFLFHK